jgi:hypothetical protein
MCTDFQEYKCLRLLRCYLDTLHCVLLTACSCQQVTQEALGTDAGIAPFECLRFVPDDPQKLICKRRDGRLCVLRLSSDTQPQVLASWRVHTQPAGPCRFSQRVMFGCTSDGHYVACGVLPNASKLCCCHPRYIVGGGLPLAVPFTEVGLFLEQLRY